METAKQALHPKEWSGSPCPLDPDNYWADDETGERVSAVTGERRPYTQQELEKVLRLT